MAEALSICRGSGRTPLISAQHMSRGSLRGYSIDADLSMVFCDLLRTPLFAPSVCEESGYPDLGKHVISSGAHCAGTKRAQISRRRRTETAVHYVLCLNQSRAKMVVAEVSHLCSKGVAIGTQVQPDHEQLVAMAERRSLNVNSAERHYNVQGT